MLVDVHAHLEFEQFDKDRDEVIERAKKAGVVAIINSGINKRRIELTLQMLKKYDIMKASLGIYPTEQTMMTEKEVEEILETIRKNKKNIVAIGEVGLDFLEQEDTKEEQKKNLLNMIDFAEELKLPMIIHSRKAEQECIEILETSKQRKIMMHCFSGSKKLIKRCEKNGWMFSIPTNITFSEHFQMMAKEVSMSQIMTETDAPFLPPVKGERNEPANVRYTIKKIAELKKLDEEEVEKMVYSNYQKFFLK
ncbi:MAG: TatD family hydrolase [Candidatus Nanoarchaeia archaeon]